MLKNTRIGLPLIGSKYWYAGVTIVDFHYPFCHTNPQRRASQTISSYYR